ncbi:hypothetical protein [Bacillus sp. AK031]
MEKLIVVPRTVENNSEGFHFLASIFEETKDLHKAHITLQFKNTRWFEANLSAVLSAWIEVQRKNKNKVTFLKVSNSIRKVFLKNGFYTYYDKGSEDDIFDSTISFKVFNTDQDEDFITYIIEHVLPKIRLKIENKVAKGFVSSLSEVFINVKTHAKSDQVITCGQYYHKHRKVCFTIVDIGKTIGNNVKAKLQNPYLEDHDAIDWATKWGNTTKQKDEPGGIGLHIIDEFLVRNGGTFQITSGNGYWEKEDGIISKEEMPSYFPGTIVNIQSSLENTFEDNSLIIYF